MSYFVPRAILCRHLSTKRKSISKHIPQDVINWRPGHMSVGMRAMIGKLNTVDCIIEVHDARLPLIGRNSEFRHHLGLIKPHILVLNKSDLADLSQWSEVKRKLAENGDTNVLLTDLSGSEFTFAKRGYTNLISKAINLINQSSRYNRASMMEYKFMIVGIPNVGKSTLLNRLRQYHIGKKGEPARTGNMAGITRSVEFMVRICARPPVYCFDTPGVLDVGATKDHDQAMKLALCSTITDKILNPMEVAQFLLDYLNSSENNSYVQHFGLKSPENNIVDLCKKIDWRRFGTQKSDNQINIDDTCWKIVRMFRKGIFGTVMFE